MKKCLCANLACACLAFALFGSAVPNAKAQNRWGEDDSNPGEFGLVFGAGSWNCRHWLSSSAAQTQGNSWILGWWTATNGNGANAHFVGSEIGAGGVLAKIKGRCQMNLDMALTNAVGETYFRVGQAEKKSVRKVASRPR